MSSRARGYVVAAAGLLAWVLGFFIAGAAVGITIDGTTIHGAKAGFVVVLLSMAVPTVIAVGVGVLSWIAEWIAAGDD